MASSKKGVRLINAALDETPLRGGSTILRGVIDQETLENLRIDDYQREASPLSSLSSIMQAIAKGDPLPEIELGMRGHKVSGDGAEYILMDDTYIIDGQQRVGAALYYLTKHPEAPVRIGAVVHFDTNFEWEKDRFRVLNSSRMKVAPSVLLRNERDSVPIIGTLYGLSNNDRHFPLFNRVCWKQKKARSDLVTGLSLVKIANMLHAHKSSGHRTSLNELMTALAKTGKVVGVGNVRDNVKEFFQLIDDCWGIRSINYVEAAPHLKSNFLLVMAKLLSDHYAFWRGDDEKVLSIPLDLRRKLKSFSVHDHAVVNLAGSGGRSRYILYSMIRDHINSGKRTKHIRSRIPEGGVILDGEDDDAVPEIETAAA